MENISMFKIHDNPQQLIWKLNTDALVYRIFSILFYGSYT